MTTFRLTLQTNDAHAGIRQLRWLLKTLARQHGLTCINAQEEIPQTDPPQGAPAQHKTTGGYLTPRAIPQKCTQVVSRATSSEERDS